MRHKRRGRKLGRSPKHQRALLRSLASNLFLTEFDFEAEAERLGKAPPENLPKQESKGRIVTTLAKAKEVRPLVEKCITIARRALIAQAEAGLYATTAERNSDQWRTWRDSDEWYRWNQAIAPALTARRRIIKLLGNKRAVRALFDEIAPRFADRNGGYTRILRLASPRLGDAGIRAILEFVGKHEREQVKAEAPSFETDQDEPETVTEETAAETDDAAAQDEAAQDPGEAPATTEAETDEPAEEKTGGEEEKP